MIHTVLEDIVNSNKIPNKEHFYVENIRRTYAISFKEAKNICDIGVKENLFSKKINVRCPICSRIIESVTEEKYILQDIECIICEANEEETFTFLKKDCPTIESYSLNRNK